MIGLRRGTVQLVDHQKSWSMAYNRERKILRRELGSYVCDIQHVGSTSIPGIQAKPIIDINIGVVSVRGAKQHMTALQRLGYTLRTPPSPTGRHWKLTYVKGPEGRRMVHLHVLRYQGVLWRKNILFRDTLRKNKRLARQYEHLKKTLAAQFPNDRKKYTAGKLPFIFRVQKRYRRTI